MRLYASRSHVDAKKVDKPCEALPDAIDDSKGFLVMVPHDLVRRLRCSRVPRLACEAVMGRVIISCLGPIVITPVLVFIDADGRLAMNGHLEHSER